MTRILYAAGNRPGANIQLSRFLQRASDFDVYIAAYASHGQLPTIDWSLDIFAKETPKETNHLIQNIKKDIIEFAPDLVISDGEFIIPAITDELKIPLWSCSSLHLLDGCAWDHSQIKSRSYLYQTNSLLASMPKAQYKFAYSPFCDISMRPILKQGYEWIRPYYESPKVCYESHNIHSQFFNYIRENVSDPNVFFCTGETSFVADAFYSNKKICINSSATDPESLLNGFLCEWLGIGYDAGDLNKTNIKYIKEQIDIFLNKKLKLNISKQKIQTLDERIKHEIFSS
jgi:hypothetical protein